MKKFALVLVLAVAGVVGLSPSPARAYPLAGLGYITWGSDYVYIDGYDDNGMGPLSGFVYVGLDRACAGTSGSYGHSEDGYCIPA